uniref:Uncharacterized protein n=1 Tax=Octopus bimaculoides TaxID=37653 RepID=A0A0L8GF62_OCTBM
MKRTIFTGHQMSADQLMSVEKVKERRPRSNQRERSYSLASQASFNECCCDP